MSLLSELLVRLIRVLSPVPRGHNGLAADGHLYDALVAHSQSREALLKSIDERLLEFIQDQKERRQEWGTVIGGADLVVPAAVVLYFSMSRRRQRGQYPLRGCIRQDIWSLLDSSIIGADRSPASQSASMFQLDLLDGVGPHILVVYRNGGSPPLGSNRIHILSAAAAILQGLIG
jgi:hypothetical protein